MNQRRLAQIHEQLAELHRELALLYADDPANETKALPSPKRKPVRAPYRPEEAPSDQDRQAAAKALHRAGIYVKR